MFVEVTYICQTYAETPVQGGKVLVRDKEFQFKTSREAEGRAQRAFEAGQCVGADAYSVMFDPETEELSDPVFLARFGKVPSVEG
jgi:hypothetical protein